MALLGDRIVARVWPRMVAAGATDVATYHHVGEPVLDIETGQTTTPITTVSVRMLFANYDRADVDGVHVVAGDQLVYMPKSLLTPAPDARDRVLRNGASWEIVVIEESGNGALWKLQIRRAIGAGG